MTDEIVLDDTELITCPHCGYANPDSWELSADMAMRDGDEIETTCSECKQRFIFRISIDTTYTSWIEETDEQPDAAQGRIQTAHQSRYLELARPTG